MVCATLFCSALAYSQTAGKAAGAKAADELPDTVEITAFGGVSLYEGVETGLDTRLAGGGVIGGRVAVNVSRWVGLEGWVDYSHNNVEFGQSSGVVPAGSTIGVPGSALPPYEFGQYSIHWALNPVFNLTPRGSRVQPYLTFGVGGAEFNPTSDEKAYARLPAVNAAYGAASLDDNLQWELNYGGGLKVHLTDQFGVRFDVRGLFSPNPTFDLPNYPDGGLYIPNKNKLSGMQATLGLVWFAGSKKCPPPPPAPPAPEPLSAGSVTGADAGTTLCVGKPVALHSTASGASGHALTYAWKLNGQSAGSNSADFSFTPNNAGAFQVEVTVSDATPPPAPAERPKEIPVRCWVAPPVPPPPAPVTASATVTVTESGPPAISSVTATPSSLTCGDTTHQTQLAVSAAPGVCGGGAGLTYKWTVSEGSVSNDTGANATFDEAGLNLTPGAADQLKTVTATVTVTDETGKTASKTVDVPVNCPGVKFVRLSDVVFAKNNTRVNNCGKRVLIDDAAPKLAAGDYTVILVGHRDADEAAKVAAAKGKGKKHAAMGLSLDEERVLNAAAVLTGGTGTCAKVDPAKVKVEWVGTDQTSTPDPALCGTSATHPAQQERKGAETSEADKNRRVEVYLVPAGATLLPPGVKEPQPIPASTLKAGCPK
jgi:hypothetical protein